MTKGLWLNLPVKDVKTSVQFFEAIGFSINEKRTNETMGAVFVGTDKHPVMLFQQDNFKGTVRAEIADANKSAELMISFDASSKDEIDETAKKVAAAGGNVWGQPETIQGWMYGFAFSDLDGHRWNMLYMDNDKMPK